MTSVRRRKPIGKSGVLREEARLPLPVDLARAGWSLIPVNARNKRPLVDWARYQEEIAPGEQIEAWTKQFPGYAWAVILGRVSGDLIAVDIDSPRGYRWVDEQGGLHGTEGPWAETGRGWVYFFSVPEECSAFTRLVPAEDVEILGNHHTHIVPPATHANGKTYRWCIAPDLTQPIPTAPEWVLDLIRGKDQGQVSSDLSTPVASNTITRYTTPKPKPGPEFHRLISLSHDSETCLRVLRELCHADAEAMERTFLCPLPGHDEKHPSAALYQVPGKPVYFHDFHARDLQYEWLSLPEVFAAVRRGRLSKFGDAEQIVWWLRMLVELGVAELPDLSLPDLPTAAPHAATQIWVHFCLLLRIRELYAPGQYEGGTPFSWSFARRWCGIGSDSTVKTGLDWLRDQGFLQVVVPGKAIGSGRRCTLFGLGPAWRKADSVDAAVSDT